MAVAIVEAGFLLHAWARRPQSYDALGGADAVVDLANKLAHRANAL
jgi:hypothetical protein